MDSTEEEVTKAIPNSKVSLTGILSIPCVAMFPLQDRAMQRTGVKSPPLMIAVVGEPRGGGVWCGCVWLPPNDPDPSPLR